MQPLLLGQGPALEVRIGCIVRCTPEGHVCYLSSAFKLHRCCLSSPAEMPVPRVILKRKSCVFPKTSHRIAGGCHFPQDLRENVQCILRSAPFLPSIGLSDQIPEGRYTIPRGYVTRMDAWVYDRTICNTKRSTSALGVYMRERGKAEVRPPSRVIVAAVNHSSLRHNTDGRGEVISVPLT